MGYVMMDMFEWEPVDDTVDPDANYATRVAGVYYFALHVEQLPNNKWYASFIAWDDMDGVLPVEESSEYDTEAEAQEFALRFDLRQMRAKVARGEADETEEAWLAMAEGEGE